MSRFNIAAAVIAAAYIVVILFLFSMGLDREDRRQQSTIPPTITTFTTITNTYQGDPT